MTRRFAAIALALILALLGRWAAGFSSIAIHTDNHRQITRDAIEELDYEFLDMKSYRGAWYNGLVNASAHEGAHSDPVTGIETWDSGHFAWRQEGRRRYLRGEFLEAYECFGYAIHLVQDDFSPPHKYCVFHGGNQIDGFEYSIAPKYWNRIPKSDPGFSGLADRAHPFTLADYMELQVRPAALTPNSEFVAQQGRPFWLRDDQDDDDLDDSTRDKNDNSEPDFKFSRPWDLYIADYVDEYQIRAKWGSYGGQYKAGDRIPGEGNEDGDWFTNASVVSTIGERIVLQSLWDAKVATKKKLRAISLTLPPVVRGYLVGDGKADPARIDREAGTPVRFRIYENHTADVFVTVETADRGPIRDAAGIVWNRRKVTLPPEYDGVPFGQAVELSWRGDLADGGSLFQAGRNSGVYALRIVVEDSDGNSTPGGGVLLPLAQRGPDVFNYHIWNVDVANVPPFVRALKVSQGPTLVYRAAWSQEEPGREKRRLQGADEALPVLVSETTATLPLFFEVEFSQAVTAPAMTLQGIDVALEPSNDPSRWLGNLRSEALRAHARLTELQVEIRTGVERDLPLDADPSTVAVRVGETWEGNETGPDRCHKLKMSGDGWDVYSLYREYLVRYIADAGKIAESVRGKVRRVGVDRDEKPLDAENYLKAGYGVYEYTNYLKQDLEWLDKRWVQLHAGELSFPDFLTRAHESMEHGVHHIYGVQAAECEISTSLNEVWQTRDSWRLYNKYNYFHLTDEQRAELVASEKIVRQDALRRHEMDTRRLLRRRRVLVADLVRLEEFSTRGGRLAVAEMFRKRAHWWWDMELAPENATFNGSPGLSGSCLGTNHAYQIDWVQMKFWFIEKVENELEMDDAIRAEPVESLWPRR